MWKKVKGKFMQKDKWGEECGIFAVRTSLDQAVGLTYNALLALQHRGQQSAGIAALHNHTITCRKDMGLISEALTREVLEALPPASYAIGHVRYSTGQSNEEDSQPSVTEYLKGRIAVAHNGNILNVEPLKEKLFQMGCRFGSTQGGEVISSLIAAELMHGRSMETAVEKAVKQLKGAFCLVVLTSDNRIIAVRDVHGFRPLCIGQKGSDFAFASESCALTTLGFDFVRDVAPGEMVMVGEDGALQSKQIINKAKKGLCIFEYVYFARPDSDIDGLSVYQARFNAGAELAREYPVEADIVCGVPDSGLEAAQGYAAASGIPYTSGFVKNRYIGRSFIFPTQSEREMAVRIKLNPLESNIRGKRVIIVDDSIVRGTTSALIINTLKQAGAREVHVRISSPPFRHMCYFGTDIDSTDDLIANRMDMDEIARFIGADSLGFISVKGLQRACAACQTGLCEGCFTGRYPMNPEV